MQRIDRDTRVAGLIYLLLTLIAPFRLIYIPSHLIVSSNAPATVANFLTHETLFRLGIVSDLWVAAISLLLTVTLYRLFREVNRSMALLMLAFGVMDTPLYLINLVNDVAALSVAHGAYLLTAFGPAQRDALVMLFVHLHGQMIVCSEIFWGLWLFPLAALVYRCGFLPRFLAVWLVINGFAYLALSLTGLLWPAADDLMSSIAFPCQLGEVALTLWMVIGGARTSRRTAAHAVVTQGNPLGKM